MKHKIHPITYVARAIMAFAVLSIIGQTVWLIIAFQDRLVVSHQPFTLTPLGFLLMLSFWLNGSILGNEAAWPALLVILAALLVLKHQDGFALVE